MLCTTVLVGELKHRYQTFEERQKTTNVTLFCCMIYVQQLNKIRTLKKNNVNLLMDVGVVGPVKKRELI